MNFLYVIDLYLGYLPHMVVAPLWFGKGGKNFEKGPNLRVVKKSRAVTFLIEEVGKWLKVQKKGIYLNLKITKKIKILICISIFIIFLFF